MKIFSMIIAKQERTDAGLLREIKQALPKLKPAFLAQWSIIIMKLSFGGPSSRPLFEIFADGTNISSCVSTRQKTEGILHMGLRKICVVNKVRGTNPLNGHIRHQLSETNFRIKEYYISHGQISERLLIIKQLLRTK